MTEETKVTQAPGEAVTRLLDLQQKYGMDQESMLIYINSVNLMSILGLIKRRYGGAAGVSMPLPDLAAVPEGAPAIDSLVGMLAKMLGGKGGGSLPEGQGINPAFLMNLLKNLGVQNIDVGSLMNLLAGLVGSGAKPAIKPGGDGIESKPGTTQPSDPGIKESTPGMEKAKIRETPKIMKWDQLEDWRRA